MPLAKGGSKIASADALLSSVEQFEAPLQCLGQKDRRTKENVRGGRGRRGGGRGGRIIGGYEEEEE